MYVKFDSFCKMVNDCGRIVTIHAGSKSSSVENITNCLPHKIALKHDLLEQYDVFEMGKVYDIQEYKEIVLDKGPFNGCPLFNLQKDLINLSTE